MDSEKSLGIVKRFYDQFPYPPIPFQEEKPLKLDWRLSYECSYAYCTGALPQDKKSQSNIRILDAGCGTGFSTNCLAYLNPGAEILAIDISGNALALARQRVEVSGANQISNIRFLNCDLYDLNKDHKFDYINSHGVLHHLSNPASALKYLDSLLNENGLLNLLLYSLNGRRDVTLLKQTFKTLRLNNDVDGIGLARKLINNLPDDNLIKRNYEEKWSLLTETDVDFADTYFHPQEIFFSLDNLFDLIDSTSLCFQKFSRSSTWNIERLLDGEFLERAKQLSLRKQLELIELLDPDISKFELFLSKSPLTRYDWIDNQSLLNTTGCINRLISGWPGEQLFDLDWNEVRLSESAQTLLESMESNPGISFRDLPLEWDSSLMASTARDLQQQQILLLSPPEQSA